MEDNKNILNVIDENGENVEIEVFDIFEVEEYPGKEYILYTKNETEGDYVKTYISILNETETKATLDAILDDKEFEVIKNKIEAGD